MKPDGTMDLDTCADISEKLSEILDANDPISEEYTLEVCSPGAEREIKDLSELTAGQYIFVRLKEPFKSQLEFTGEILNVKIMWSPLSTVIKQQREKLSLIKQTSNLSAWRSNYKEKNQQLKLKDILSALNAVEEEKNIPEDVILDALCEAMAKAYKKDAELADIEVTAEINKKKQTIDLVQSFLVVESVEDDELEISLEDAKEIDPNAEIGGRVSRPIEFTTMSRAAASLARNVMRQKIREAEKTAVYDEYVNKTNELVIGIVESVKDKFTLVNLGKNSCYDAEECTDSYGKIIRRTADPCHHYRSQ